KNMPKNIQALYFMKTYEIDKICHPEFVLVDSDYTKKVLKQLHNSKIMTLLRYVFTLNISAIKDAFKRKIHRSIEK
ncbi:MAG: hypothetical protein PHC91_03560, partial [Eubacteriales bacterium]|nr:hypothetical protein [Eubacteriales bacterium]